MARRYTMATLVESWKQLAGMKNDDSIADPVWKSFGNMVYGEMWSEVSPGDRYFETSYSFTANGSASYTEPVGHFSTMRIARVLDDGTEYDLDEVPASDEAEYRGRTGDAVAYALIDDQLYLLPKPSSGSYVWYYTQQPTDISAYADVDVVDVVSPPGEQFLAWGVVALALHNQRRDASFAMAEREKARTQLQHWAANRNLVGGGQRGLIENEFMFTTPGDWGPFR
ncbi:MAG TPA: hypothetical protein VLT45_07785 [Kofleriaceae bacterium]|nr:hypothetical protein [Kofleriaceae bacterium]